MARATATSPTRVSVNVVNSSHFPPPDFTPQASCTRDIYNTVYTGVDLTCLTASNSEEVACRFFHLGQTTQASECMPKDWAPDGFRAWYHSPKIWRAPLSGGTWLAPGSCPEGYEFACASMDKGGPSTTATCCPSGYTCVEEHQWPWQITEPCYSVVGGTEPLVYTTRMAGQDLKVVTTEGEDHTIHAYGLRVEYRSAELSLYSDVISTELTTQATTSMSATSSTSGVSRPENSNSGSPEPSETSMTGLSTGHKAGIGAGIAMAGLLLVAALVWRWRHRSRRQANPAQEPLRDTNALFKPSEMEYPEQQRYEIGASKMIPAELGPGQIQPRRANEPAELGTYR